MSLLGPSSVTPSSPRESHHADSSLDVITPTRKSVPYGRVPDGLLCGFEVLPL